MYGTRGGLSDIPVDETSKGDILGLREDIEWMASGGPSVGAMSWGFRVEDMSV